MTLVIISKMYYDHGVVESQLVAWMNENVGKYGTEWKWVSMATCDLSVYAKDPEKALLTALRWGVK
jgi:hypothetical protein